LQVECINLQGVEITDLGTENSQSLAD
jgi:hypothetical protein